MKRLLQILFEECLCYITLLKVQGKKHFLWLTCVLVFKKPCFCLFFAGLIFKHSSTVQLCYYFFFFLKWCKMLCIYQSSNSVLFFPYPILMFIFVSISPMTEISIPSIICHHETECLASLKVLYLLLVIVRWPIFIFHYIY